MTVTNLRRTDAHAVAVNFLEPSHRALQCKLAFSSDQQAARTGVESRAVVMGQDFYSLVRKGELEALRPMSAAAFDRIVCNHGLASVFVVAGAHCAAQRFCTSHSVDRD